MSLISLLTKNLPKRTVFQDSTRDDARKLLIIDATISETATYNSDVTDYEVETGADVTDNIRQKPIELQISGLVSETPIDIDSQLAGLATAAAVNAARTIGFNPGLAALGAAAGLGTTEGRGAVKRAGNLIRENLLGIKNEEGTDKGKNPAELARDALVEMWTNKSRFAIITKRAQFTDMVITNLTFPRSQSDGNSLRFEMTVKQIRVVEPKSVLIEKKIRTTKAHGASKANLGQQATQATNEQEKRKGSLLFNLIKGRGIL